MPELNLCIIDYGMGNIRSVQNAFTRLGVHATVSQKPEDLNSADAIILPGVGAFAEAMNNLRKLNLMDAIAQNANAKKPILGICLGMQLLAESSSERGSSEGLGLIPGKVERIDVPKEFRLPHVGWNDIIIKQSKPLFTQITDAQSFYFVHSYHFICEEKYIAAYTNYSKNLVAAVQNDNVMGAQFHPERSQNSGKQLLQNFINYALEHKANQEKVAC